VTSIAKARSRPRILRGCKWGRSLSPPSVCSSWIACSVFRSCAVCHSFIEAHFLIWRIIRQAKIAQHFEFQGQQFSPTCLAAFNNTGVMARIAPTADSAREDWDRVIGVNLQGVWSCMKHELRQMERQSSGAIVNNASIGALTGNPGIASYIASKHGVVGLTRTAALEYVKRGIRVNAVNPGLIDTQIARDVVAGDEQAYAALEKGVPMGRAGRPEEIASVVLWLCSPGASYVVGHALTVDGGVTVV
jgi:NAD(P)-dependent dehydrogenase (short-subunit alcohol dehydrogenase family)